MISTLEALKMQLRQAIIQLEQAEKSLDKEEMMHASIYVQNAKWILMKMGVRLLQTIISLSSTLNLNQQKTI